jgi:hypothetical protein
MIGLSILDFKARSRGCIMILLVGFYEDPAVARMQELVTCLERNLANKLISEVHLFLEVAGDLDRLAAAYPLLRHPKLRLVPHGRRSTYRELFDHANRNLAGRRAIVANADIYFDHTLARLDAVDLAGKLACLSRWDVLADGSARFFDHPSSQDAWIFQAPIPPMSCDFHMGLLGCDNRLAWEAQAAGLVVFNPSRSVRIYHLHRSQVRRYTEQQRLTGPVLSIEASTLGTPWLSPNVPTAEVAFAEEMGYVVAQLEKGVSSHTNIARPLAHIPAPLAGKPFTQVVAYQASPVEVEFLSPGKLYVLVGTDWYGYEHVTRWLASIGYREPLPALTTTLGTTFEVWSLIGEVGESLVIPTQTMLVAEQLRRRA